MKKYISNAILITPVGMAVNMDVLHICLPFLNTKGCILKLGRALSIAKYNGDAKALFLCIPPAARHISTFAWGDALPAWGGCISSQSGDEHFISYQALVLRTIITGGRA